MSYDLMVFDPEAAPNGRREFLAWYDRQTEGSESHGYNNPSIPSALLQNWFNEILRSFPPMNGPLAPKDDPEDDTTLTDYSVGRQVIYAAFAWSQAKAAYELVFRLAAKYGVGFFDVSSDEAPVWLPEKPGTLVKAHSA